jgi:hypothetical protein
VNEKNPLYMIRSQNWWFSHNWLVASKWILNFDVCKIFAFRFDATSIYLLYLKPKTLNGQLSRLLLSSIAIFRAISPYISVDLGTIWLFGKVIQYLVIWGKIAEFGNIWWYKNACITMVFSLYKQPCPFECNNVH